MTRAFISVPLPEMIRANLLELDRTQQGISWSPPGQWHITLQFFEDVDIKKVKESLLGMKAQGAVATIGPRVTRLGEEVLVVPVNGLSRLAEQVRSTMSPQSSGVSLPYVGHITLGRIKNIINADLEGVRIEGSFRVTELLLVESRGTPNGYSHSVVGSQRLV